jgi:NAD(P)H dehydrogenase (quinone)
VIAVTGSTGAVGGHVARRLAERGAAQRLIVRDPARAPELEGAEVAVAAGYSDTENMRAALTGADTLFMVSGREQLGRVAEHAAAVDAAVAAGVGRIVYLSFFGAAPDCTFTFGRDHFHTEQHIRAAGIPFTFLRDNLYLDFIPFFCGADGVIRGPAGDGRAGFVARADVADVAAAVLTGDGHEGKTYDLTGAESISLARTAELLSEVTGREIRFHDETLEEARASRAPSGEPDWVIEGWVTTYAAIAAGELDGVTGAVERLAGHEPYSVERWLREHPDSYAHLV